MKSLVTAKGKLIVQYPPDFDGELHIEYERTFKGEIGFSDTFQFTLSGKGTLEQKLIQACKDILRQFE